MLRLFAFPLHLKLPNGYWDGLYGALGALTGAEMHHNNFLDLLISFHRPQVIHIHWPSILYASKWRAGSVLKFFARIGVLTVSILRGDTIIWTMHNYHDHDGKDQLFERLAMRWLTAFSSSIIVHSPAGARYLAATHHRTRSVYVIPHGSYVGFHGPKLAAPDPVIRKRLGIDVSDRVFMCLGSVRPYKQLELLVRIFNRLPVHCKLIIAGKPFFDRYLAQLRELNTKGNVIIYPSSIPHHDIPSFFSIAHFSVFAFGEDTLTSGSVILSLSYGVPVIARKVGDMPYVVEDGVDGFLYDTDQELAQLIKRCVNMRGGDALPVMGTTALARMSAITYTNIAKKTMQAYHIT